MVNITAPKLAVLAALRTLNTESVIRLSDSELLKESFISDNSMRLTLFGYGLLCGIIQFYAFEFPKPLLSKHLLALSSFEYPYFISQKTSKLYISSEADAVAIRLCGGLNNFLESYY